MNNATLDARTFRAYQEFIYDVAGIHYPDEKLTLLSNRVGSRLRKVAVDGYTEYLDLIKAASAAKELQEFLNAITTNETYFFRCPRHWDFFRAWLEEQKASRRSRKLRIWSAAASNGSEAYSIAISCLETLGPNLGGFDIEILGTDLNDQVLEEARSGRYYEYAVSQTPEALRKKYFRLVDDDRFQVDARVNRMATFHRHNLKSPLAASLAGDAPFDFIFIRNVMIYFDVPSKENVLGHLRRRLAPGGFLMIGESESLLNTEHGMTYVQPSVFMMPGPNHELPARLRNLRR